MNNLYLKSIAFSPAENTDYDAEIEDLSAQESEEKASDDERSEEASEKEQAVSFSKEFDKVTSDKSEAFRKAIEYALSAIQQGNNSRWAITAGGLGLNVVNVGRMMLQHGDVLARAKGAAGGDRRRGRGAAKFAGSLYSEAKAVDRKFEPLFKLFASVSTGFGAGISGLSAPPNEWIDEIMDGWEKVADDRAYYGESSLYSFIAGRSDSLLSKFKDAWLNINRFRDTTLFEDIFESIAVLKGDVQENEENIKQFLISILLWRAVLEGLRIVSADIVHESEAPKEQKVVEKTPPQKGLIADINLLAVRSVDNSAVVDRRTNNVMVDRGDLRAGTRIILVLHFGGQDHKRLSSFSIEQVYEKILNDYIVIEGRYNFPGNIFKIESDDDITKVYIALDNRFILDIINNSEDTLELFKIRFKRRYLKVEASDLELYNQIKKIASSVTTSYYTVTNSAGKNVDLSIADMVMRRGYVAGPGDKFKPKSLAGKILKKKKNKA